MKKISSEIPEKAREIFGRNPSVKRGVGRFCFNLAVQAARAGCNSSNAKGPGEWAELLPKEMGALDGHWLLHDLRPEWMSTHNSRLTQ